MAVTTAFSKSAGERPENALRFSTADYAPRERLDAWREIYGRTLLKLEIEPVEVGAFHTDVRMRRLPGLGMITGARSATLYRRTRTDGDDLMMSFGLGGGFEAMQFGRTERMEAGDAVVVTAGATGYVRAPAAGRTITLCVPRQPIARMVGDLESTLCRRIPAGNAALALLTGYVGILENAAALAAPDVQRQAVTHVHDLIALALGATREAADVAKARGVRAARLRAIKADIAAHLSCDDLAVATVAARHRLPVRYVQRLFESEGVTFTDFVLDQRLACAHRLLADPRFAGLKIGMVAAEAGFSDLSYFNRAFRRRFGVTPTDVRAQAAG
jgi:AraC-like DNA-binding protein